LIPILTSGDRWINTTVKIYASTGRGDVEQFWKAVQIGKQQQHVNDLIFAMMLEVATNDIGYAKSTITKPNEFE
jgi:hypothetical protein